MFLVISLPLEFVNKQLIHYFVHPFFSLSMPSINSVFAGVNGAFACAGDIECPMYQSIKNEGTFIRASSRRERLRAKKKTLSLKRIKANSPKRSSKGFGI